MGLWQTFVANLCDKGLAKVLAKKSREKLAAFQKPKLKLASVF
jgi:hypothetical protein